MLVRDRSCLTVLALGALAACGGGGAIPAAPTLDDPPTLTNQNPVVLAGSAEAGASVAVRGGAVSPTQAVADGSGHFTVAVMLNPDADNTLLVSQSVGGVESPTSMITITHDGTPPERPSLDPVVSPTRRDVQRLRGTTERGATIRVTGGAGEAMASADDTGRFDVDVMLSTVTTDTVDNDLSIVATDLAGNEGPAATATITFDPSIPVEAPVLDDYPAYTSTPTITLTGQAEAGVRVNAVGGATDGTAVTMSDGTFSLEVGLRPNSPNTITFFAVMGNDTSAPVTALITHDDIAPEPPALDPQASPTGAVTIPLSGASEPRAHVSVSGAASAASGDADEAGVFAIDVMLSADADNALSVVATDLAGNASEAALLTIHQDSTLEEPITLDPVASPTRDATVTLSGHAANDVDIQITGGASTVMTRSNASDGRFTANVPLHANDRNELRVTRPGSGVDTIVVIVHDSIAPDAPSLNDIPSPTGSTSLMVSGTTEPRTSVSVSGATSAVSTTAGTDGRFSASVTIAGDSSSTLTVVATDRAGNASLPATAMVTHSSSVPPAPVVDVPSPPPTSTAMHTVTGRVTSPGAGITIRIAGGGAAATGPTDPGTGRFSIDVMLVANEVNSLSVTSMSGAIESPPALVTITHDDIAPARPDAAHITASAGTCLVIASGGTVSGSMSAVEARASVRIQNITRGTSATTTATDGGSFSVGLTTCNGNVIRITATDAAGNASEFMEVNAS